VAIIALRLISFGTAAFATFSTRFRFHNSTQLAHGNYYVVFYQFNYLPCGITIYQLYPIARF
jgi:hypothetical protein